MAEKPKLYPKVTQNVGSTAEHIADSASFSAMATGVLSDMHAAEFGSDSRCIDGKLLVRCEAVKQVLDATVERVPVDENIGHTGWVGYEPANADCGDCEYACSARVFWQNGRPQERVRFLFYKKIEPDVVIYLDNQYYNS